MRTAVVWFCICCAWTITGSDAETLRVGTSRQPVASPLYFAAEKGLFATRGLTVKVVEFETGRAALGEFLRGGLDAVTCAETPIVIESLNGAKFKVIATVGSTDASLTLMARKDRGIEKSGDLRGKRLGLVRGTNSEFFFEMLRVLHGLSPQEVTIVPLQPDQLAGELMEGRVDAVIIWEHLSYVLYEKMANQLFVDNLHGLYRFSWNFVTSDDQLRRRRSDFVKLLAGLGEAANRIAADPEAAAEMLATAYQVNATRLKKSLAACEFSPVLRQDLLVQFEEQARWLIRREGAGASLPNYLRFVNTAVLKEALPGTAVITVIE